MAAGDVEGFASVAFPLVRRVFGGLLANDVVSVQPMSLPSGLIFFLDFTYEAARLGLGAGESVYGGGVVGNQLTGGVSDITEDGGGLYNLQSGFSTPTSSVTITQSVEIVAQASGGIGAGGVPDFTLDLAGTNTAAYELENILRFDPDLTSGSSFVIGTIAKSTLTQANFDEFVDFTLTDGGITTLGSSGAQVRRLTREDPTNSSNIIVTITDSTVALASGSLVATDGIGFPITDNFTSSVALGSVVGADTWGLEEPSFGTGNAGSLTGKVAIPEIDIKVDSIAVTAQTRKLKAKWSPELGQDLNAYHNLDAEVELTSILSEQIALEIDREILNDLIAGATAGKYYWSRSPGLFVNRTTGVEVGAGTTAPDFTGTVSEWYETLIETINDVSAQIHRKTLRGGANFIVTSPEVANILEFTSGFRASVTADADTGTRHRWCCQRWFTLQEVRRLRRSLLPTQRRSRRSQGQWLPRERLRLRSIRPTTGHADHLRYRGFRPT
jgi:hypothetical protein